MSGSGGESASLRRTELFPANVLAKFERHSMAVTEVLPQGESGCAVQRKAAKGLRPVHQHATLATAEEMALHRRTVIKEALQKQSQSWVWARVEGAKKNRLAKTRGPYAWALGAFFAVLYVHSHYLWMYPPSEDYFQDVGDNPVYKDRNLWAKTDPTMVVRQGQE